MNAVRLQQREAARTVSATAGTTAAPSLSEAAIAARLDEGRWLLDDGRAAAQALSCLIAPAPGDRVLVLSGEETFVLAVLARAQLDEALLTVPRASGLAIRQARIELAASEHAALRSLGDLELAAPAGTLTLGARNLFTTVAGALVENARDYVGRFAQCLLEAKGLLRAHGGQALVTADKHIRLDAERIDVG